MNRLLLLLLFPAAVAVAATSDPALQPYQDAGGAVGAQAGSNYDATDSYNTTKDVSGLVSADTGGSFGQVGSSTVIRRSEGKLKCEDGKDNYVGGVVVRVESCNKSLVGSIVSMDVSICTKTQRGQRCDDPSEFTETGTIDAVVGSDSYVGIITFNLLEPCDVDRSSCKFEIRQTGIKDIDVNQMNEDAAAIIAEDGEAGLARSISDSVMGIGFADGRGVGADIANCFEAQNNELLDEGTITTCGGNASADFGQVQDCTPVMPWTESCQADLPSHVVHCQAGELTCHREHPYDVVTCNKGINVEWRVIEDEDIIVDDGFGGKSGDCKPDNASAPKTVTCPAGYHIRNGVNGYEYLFRRQAKYWNDDPYSYDTGWLPKSSNKKARTTINCDDFSCTFFTKGVETGVEVHEECVSWVTDTDWLNNKTTTTCTEWQTFYTPTAQYSNPSCGGNELYTRMAVKLICQKNPQPEYSWVGVDTCNKLDALSIQPNEIAQ